MAKEYEGTVMEIEGDRAVIEIIGEDCKKMEVVFHKDTLVKYDVCHEGARIKYIPSEHAIKPIRNLFKKILR